MKNDTPILVVGREDLLPSELLRLQGKNINFVNEYKNGFKAQLPVLVADLTREQPASSREHR